MNRLSESSSKSACSELGTVLLFLSPCFMKQGARNKRTVPILQHYLLKNCSQIRKLISGMVAWGM